MYSEGLNTTVFPAIRAGMIFQVGMATGKFQGVMAPTTPTGARIDMANFCGNSEGTVWPASRRPSPAM